jgi:quercetin dioxygenase-like cupin family protein
MSEQRHSIVQPGGGVDYDWANDHIYIKTPLEVTDGRVTLAEDLLKPGFHLARHHHRKMTELFYVLEGEVSFAFDDETQLATVGAVVNVPAGVWHEVDCTDGGRMITIFTPGGFDHYLAELAGMSPEQFADAALMETLGERYDIWHR